MSDAPTGETLKSEPGTDWERLRRLDEAAIHAAIEADPDACPTDEAFWQAAKVVMPHAKATVTLRLDADLLGWLKEQGRGYQTRINAILRAYMNAHKPNHP
jgi:uncharacterized protein (DUF4415 family)